MSASSTHRNAAPSPLATVAGRRNEQILVGAPGARSGEQIRHLGLTLGDMCRHRQAEVGAGFVELDRDGVGSMRRNAGTDPLRKRVADTVAEPGEVLERLRRIRPEDLEVDGGAQTELRAGHRGCTAVAAVADGRHA